MKTWNRPGASFLALLALFAIAFISSPASAQAPDKEFTISVGETLTFNARGVNRVTIGLSSVADAKPTGDGRQIVLTGKAPGVTTINIFSDRGQKTLLIRVVSVNPESLAQEVREVLGERSGVDVRVVKGRVLLEGEVASEIFKRKIDKLVEIYPQQVLNFTNFREAFVEGARMVAMDVYFIQLATTDRDNLGVGWGQFIGANYTFGAGEVPLHYSVPGDQEGKFGPGVLPEEQNPARVPVPATNLTGGDGVGFYSVLANLNLVIDLLTESGLVKEIKHGVIVTETGTEAMYHSGGTLLIRVISNDQVAVIEKEYGLKIKVKPILDFENRVKVVIDAEISELDAANGVGDLPALKNTDIRGVVNMQEGQSVLVSSQQNTFDTSNEEGWWLLSKIPILGWLFKARSYIGTNLDNAFFITPRVYEPGGKTHETLIQGAFESLFDAGAEAEDIPELSNAKAPAKAPKPKPAVEKRPDPDADLLDE